MVDEEFPVAIGHEDIADTQCADDDGHIGEEEEYPVRRAGAEVKFQIVKAQATHRETEIFAVKGKGRQRQDDIEA